MQTLVIANFKTGYETDLIPELINNDAFPILSNVRMRRGRIEKKRGAALLGRLQRSFASFALGNTSGAGTFTGNIFTILGVNILEPDANIQASSNNLIFKVVVNGVTYFDPDLSGNLKIVSLGTNHGTINYSTGAITLTGVAASMPIALTFSYYPSLPNLGDEDFDNNFGVNPGVTNFPQTVFFDSRYSYLYSQSSGIFYDVNYYKLSGNHFVWSAPDYQQFWSTNFQGAMWATNFKPGFNFKAITNITQAAAAVVTINGHGLSTNDVVFFNEVQGMTQINGLTGTVTVLTANTFSVNINSTGFTAYAGGGIAQYLTNTIAGQDGIKWFDGDPTTNGTPIASPTKGWVNFAPPLDSTLTPNYLVGAKIVLPFEGSLMFFGVYIQTSTSNPIYYPNRVVYSQDGTVFYADPVPINQTSDIQAWYQTPGFGGQIDAPLEQEIVTVSNNQDVLIIGMETRPLKLLGTGDDSNPFIFQTISPELGSQSTFSAVPLDIGVQSIGSYAIAEATQNSNQRIDNRIIDQIYDISQVNNGSQRVTAWRDFRNEFIYFSYLAIERKNWVFPNRILAFNYRDNCYSTFEQNVTHFGNFRFSNSTTWGTLTVGSWGAWTTPWNFGNTSQRYPFVVFGNQQGFIMYMDDGTDEPNSQFVQDFDPTTLIVTSPNHCLNDGDFVEMSGAIGLTNFNGQIFKIIVDYVNVDTFKLILTLDQIANPPAGTYVGGGVYKRLTNIFVQSKMFPILWDRARQTRFGTQRFLLDKTETGEIQVDIYNNQNDDTPINDRAISSYLGFSNIVLTHAEPENDWSSTQNRIWHRMSNSFNGQTIQLGFQLSDDQMYDSSINNQEIVLHAIVVDIYPGPILV